MRLFDRIREKEALLRAYHDVFEGPSGKVVLADLARRHHVLGSTYAIGATRTDGVAQAMAMAEADGERNVVLGIIRLLHIELSDLIEEANAEEARARSADTLADIPEFLR